jgi:NADPH-dependent 2,4-dienoyl-CoA reductase/sulfur reductase-like enzyme
MHSGTEPAVACVTKDRNHDGPKLPRQRGSALCGHRQRARSRRVRGGWAVKICVFGAGAIGGYMAVELALAGHDVCAIAAVRIWRPFGPTASS